MVSQLVNNDKASLLATFKEFFQELEGEKNDPTNLTPPGPYGHGRGGLFSQAGQDARVFSAIQVPMSGAMGVLPVINDADDTDSGPNFGGVQNEFMTALTGVTKGALETWANQPTTKCADGARAGLMKVCTLVNVAGNYRFSPTDTINIVDAGKRRDIADPLTLRLMNNPAIQQTFGVPTQNRSAQNALMNEWARKNYELGLSVSRFMGGQVYTANPVNNNGEAQQFQGFDLWINSGNKRDSGTQNLCTALDSDLKNFGFSLVNQNTRDIQNYAETMYAFLEYKTRREGLGENWDGVIFMRPEAWDEINKVIAVRQYQEAMNQTALFSAASRLVINGRDALEFRNMVRANSVWPLRGKNVPIVLDDSIAELDVTTAAQLIAGQYASDIYFVPMRVLGGVPVTYWKYFNHANANSEAFGRLTQNTFTTDNGVFRWYINFKNGCIDWTFHIIPKLVMRTTQIAGRIQNVAYQPLQHFSSANPDSSYFADGGRTSSPLQTLYTQWGSTELQTL